MDFQGFGRSYWTVSLDIGWFGKIVINQLSEPNVHLTKYLNQRRTARFHIFGFYLIQRKIAIV
jgi:hypothetical protein